MKQTAALLVLAFLAVLAFACSAPQETDSLTTNTQTNTQTGIAWGPECKAMIDTADALCGAPSECLSALCTSIQSKVADIEKRGATNPVAFEEECRVNKEQQLFADETCRAQP